MAEQKPVQPIIQARMKLAESEQVVYFATVETNVKREDLKDPSFWAHVAAQLRPKFEIKVYAEDGSFFAHYLVLACEKTWARVHELSFHDLAKSEITKDQLDVILKDYIVEYKGGNKWCVIRKSDNALMQSKLHSKDDALKWLQVHLNQAVAA